MKIPGLHGLILMTSSIVMAIVNSFTPNDLLLWGQIFATFAAGIYYTKNIIVKSKSKDD